MSCIPKEYELICKDCKYKFYVNRCPHATPTPKIYKVVGIRKLASF